MADESAEEPPQNTRPGLSPPVTLTRQPPASKPLLFKCTDCARIFQTARDFAWHCRTRTGCAHPKPPLPASTHAQSAGTTELAIFPRRKRPICSKGVVTKRTTSSTAQESGVSSVAGSSAGDTVTTSGSASELKRLLVTSSVNAKKVLDGETCLVTTQKRVINNPRIQPLTSEPGTTPSTRHTQAIVINTEQSAVNLSRSTIKQKWSIVNPTHSQTVNQIKSVVNGYHFTINPSQSSVSQVNSVVNPSQSTVHHTVKSTSAKPSPSSVVEPAPIAYTISMIGENTPSGYSSKHKQLGEGTSTHIPGTPVTMETRPVTMETRPVTMEPRPVTMETRPVTMEIRHVTMETKPVTMETRPVTMATKPVTMDTNHRADISVGDMDEQDDLNLLLERESGDDVTDPDMMIDTSDDNPKTAREERENDVNSGTNRADHTRTTNPLTSTPHTTALSSFTTPGILLHCEDCDVTFENETKMEKHNKRKHRDRGRDVCDVCLKSFLLKPFYVRHIKECLVQLTCVWCKRQHERHEALAVHEQRCALRAITCDLCRDRFRDRRSMLRHRATHVGEKPFTCGTCTQTFRYVDLMRRHELEHVREQKRQHKKQCIKDKVFACFICGKNCLSKTKLESHLVRHKRSEIYKQTYGTDWSGSGGDPWCAGGKSRYKAQQEQYRRRADNFYRKHPDIHRAMYKKPRKERHYHVKERAASTIKCYLCPRVFKNKEEKAKHLWREHLDPELNVNPEPRPPPEPQPYLVPQPAREPLTPRAPQPPPEPRPPTDEFIKCEDCGAEFHMASSLLSHQKYFHQRVPLSPATTSSTRPAGVSSTTIRPPGGSTPIILRSPEPSTSRVKFTATNSPTDGAAAPLSSNVSLLGIDVSSARKRAKSSNVVKLVSSNIAKSQSSGVTSGSSNVTKWNITHSAPKVTPVSSKDSSTDSVLLHHRPEKPPAAVSRKPVKRALSSKVELWTCSICGKSHNRKWNMKRHMLTHFEGDTRRFLEENMFQLPAEADDLKHEVILDVD